MFNDRAYDLHVDNNPSNPTSPTPPAPPIAPAPPLASGSTPSSINPEKVELDNPKPKSNSLLDSINSFKKNRLKSTVTVVKDNLKTGNPLGILTTLVDNTNSNEISSSTGYDKNEINEFFKNDKEYQKSLRKIGLEII
jgi:hypothetical protein